MLQIFKIAITVIILLIPIALIVICIYPVVYPLLPEAIKQSISGSEALQVFLIEDIPLIASVIIIAFCISCYIITFKLFKYKNISARMFYAGLLVVGLIFIAKQFTNETVIMIVILLPILTAIFLMSLPTIHRRVRKIEKVKETTDTGLVFNTTEGTIILNNPFRGIYIQGGAGSGKSVSLFEPIISQIAKQGYTGLLYDFKSPELSVKLMESYKSQSDIKSYFVDFKNPYSSPRLNPIQPENLEKTAFALEYSTVLINNLMPETVKKMDFWGMNSRMIIAGVIWYLRNKFPQHCTLPHVISLLLLSDADVLIPQVSSDYECAGMVASLKQAMDRGAEKQVAGVLSTVQNGLAQLNTPDIFWILSGNDFDLNLNDKNNPKFLCIGNDSTLATTYAPVISLIISVALRLMNRPGQEKSIVLLDEAPTLYIPNIEQIPATAQSNRIATVFGVQDYSQLVDRYGESKAQVILSNMGNQFYGRTVNSRSAEMIKSLFGRHDKTFQTQNTGTGSSGKFIHLSSNTNRGKSESIQERDRVKISDITSLEAGQFYGIIADGNPKEFLNKQFLPYQIKGNYSSRILTTQQQMIDNYYRIIEETKDILRR